MWDLIKLLQVTTIAAQVKNWADDVCRKAIWMIIAASLLAAGLMFLIAALWMAAAEAYGTLGTNIIFGCIGIVAGGLVYLLAVRGATSPASPSPPQPDPLQAVPEAVVQDIKSITKAISSNPLTLPLIIGTGFALGLRFGRKFFR